MIGALDETFFDRESGIVNFANSFLKAYGVETFHPSLKAADDIIKGHRKMALFLFDGMGEYVQKTHEKSIPFIRNGKFTEIFSTNPATTVAATDTIRSARYPIETGWIGWIQWVDGVGPLICFPNALAPDYKKLEGDNVMDKLCHYESVAKILKANGVNANECLRKGIVDALDHSKTNLASKSLCDVARVATRFFKNGGEFLYSYWTHPDSLMHDIGVQKARVGWYMKRIDRTIKRFVKANPDVLTFVMADHGMMDVVYEDISAHEELYECLDETKCPVLEVRTPSFFTKKGMEEKFEKRFGEIYGQTAVLMSREEAISNGYFGEGTPHPLANMFLGDYIAVMKDNRCLYDPRWEKFPHKGHHAGGTKEERVIALSAFNR